MPIPSIISYNTVKFLSELSNNSESILPMLVKDTMSNCAIVNTYKKEGGKYDAGERAIEEFGTGAIWLLGIPVVKKLLDKTIYPLLKLNPDFDVRVLEDEKNLANIKENLKNSTNSFLQNEKELFLSLDDKNEVLKKFTNKQLYKGLFAGKFVIATTLSAIALSAIIKYKQKTTNKRIEEDFKKNNASRVLLNQDLKQERSNSTVFSTFLGKKQDKNLSFKGVKNIAQLFMFNDIFNTAILDGVITGTRLKEGRKGEKKEILLKELFQIFFIYGVAKPMQMLFEHIGKKVNLPIDLDPMLLFSKDLKENIKNANKVVADNNLIVEVVSQNGKTTRILNQNAVSEIYNLAKQDINNPLIDVLAKNGAITLVKDKNGNNQAISYLKKVDNAKIFKTLSGIDDLGKNISKIKGIKAFKIFSVLGNVAIAAWAMGVLQPKINIFMRKFLNNGDNRNPAIVAKENELNKQNNQSNLIV